MFANILPIYLEDSPGASPSLLKTSPCIAAGAYAVWPPQMTWRAAANWAFWACSPRPTPGWQNDNASVNVCAILDDEYVVLWPAWLVQTVALRLVKASFMSTAWKESRSWTFITRMRRLGNWGTRSCWGQVVRLFRVSCRLEDA